MTGAELRTLRETMGISVVWLAQNTQERREHRHGVNRRSVTMWETGDVPVPDDVAQMILSIRINWLTWIQACIETALESINEASNSLGSPPADIDIYRYKTDHDLWVAHPGFQGLPATHHAAGIARVKDAIERDTGIAVNIQYAESENQH